MKVVLLCGGFGTRLAEETVLKPKPMVPIGGHPILWHIMNIYAHHGFKDFTVALGYKGEEIKSYFLNYHSLNSDVRVNLANGSVDQLRKPSIDWTVELVDTGHGTLTGGRLHRLAPRLESGGTFMLTYGDGLSNVNLRELLAFHKSHGKLATVTAVRPPARFGAMAFDGVRVTNFKEKPQMSEGWINGGFFVFEPGFLRYLKGDATVLEGEPLESAARDGQLVGFQHSGFWQCMDTLRDKQHLEEQWSSGAPPWRVWG